MKRVVIESPYAGDIERNTIYARRAMRDSLERGEAPLASHLLYPQPGILNEHDPKERQWGIDAGLEWQAMAHTVAVYEDYGISKGMKAATLEARHRPGVEMVIEYRRIGENPAE